MRFHDEYKTLEKAFTHVRSIRTFVRPNLAFLKQLADYEQKLTGVRGPWREVTQNGVTLSLPDFVLERFPEAYENEFA